MKKRGSEEENLRSGRIQYNLVVLITTKRLYEIEIT